jgi:BirA family transcriptional regulator, biotin operon repressor / biotin---[acetyl-CoA-carboxylase] ligase
MRLDPRASATGVRLVAHEVLGSTNSEALSLARQGERGPLWVTAARQTAGRGRRGRAWISEPGNLYASLLLTDPAPAERWPQLSFVAALAVYDAVIAVASAFAPRLAIKWPNDLLLDGAKFAGVLIEGSDAGGTGTVAVGIGVNCASHPPGTDYPATDLASVSTESLFCALSASMVMRLMRWDEGRGFAAIRTDWLDRAAGRGEEIRVRLADRELIGRFEALDETGALKMRMADGHVTTIAAGDVFLREPAAAGR